MKVIFDVEINNYDIVLTCSNEEFILMEEMRNFVESRIRVLEGQINAEENADKKVRATVISLLKKRIQPVGYSPELTNKILDCFSPEDVKFMMQKVEHSLQRFLK